MITPCTCGSLSKTKLRKDAIEYNTKKNSVFCRKKDLSFGPERTVEVRPNSLAKQNVRSVTDVF